MRPTVAWDGRTASRSWFELQLRATGRRGWSGSGEGPTCPGGGSSEMKLTTRIGMSTEMSAESEPPTETLTE